MSVVASFPYGQSSKPACAGADTTWTGNNDINEPVYTTYATTQNQMVPLAQAEALTVGNLVSLVEDNVWTGLNTFRNAASAVDAVLPTEFVTKGQVDATYAATGIVDLADDNIWTASQIFPTIKMTNLDDSVPMFPNPPSATTFTNLTVGNTGVTYVNPLNCSSGTDFPHVIQDIDFAIPAQALKQDNDVIFPALNTNNEGSASASWLYRCSGAYQLEDTCPNPCTIVGDGAATIQITLPQNTCVGTIINLINPANIIQVRAPAVYGTLYNLHQNVPYTSDATVYPNYVTIGGGVPVSCICINASVDLPKWLIFSIQT